jgi:hypothetical protein
MKRAYWAGAILILGFLALGLTTFTKSMTPYVTFAEAKSSRRSRRSSRARSAARTS